jgi:hypothetical protein
VAGPLEQILDPTVAEDAVTDTLKLFIETYTAHIVRGKGLDPAKYQLAPKSWRTVNEGPAPKWPEDQLPAIYVVAQGVLDDPVQDGDGWVDATFRVHVAAVVSASGEESANDLCKIYMGAIWGAIVQHRSLGGKAAWTAWRGGQWDVIGAEQARTLAGGELIFDVHIEHVVNAFEGLDAPEPGHPPDEPDAWPTVDEGGASAVIEPKE